MRNLKIILFVFCLAQSNLYALSEPDQLLLKSALKVLASASIPMLAKNSLGLEQAQQQIIRLAGLLEKIANDPDVLQKILAVRDGFYTSDGVLFRAILVTAAKDKIERDAFIAGLKYEKCKKWFWQCGLPPLSRDKIWFKFASSLKGNMDALEQKILQLMDQPEDDWSNFDPRSLDPYESYFEIFTQLEAMLGPLSNLLFGYYTEQSLQQLSQQELRELLEKLIAFLNDNEEGALGFIRKASPRS